MDNKLKNFTFLPFKQKERKNEKKIIKITRITGECILIFLAFIFLIALMFI